MNKEMQELNKKTTDELTKLVGEKREALRQFRFNMAGSRTRNTKEGAGLRKEIARILTVVGAKKAEA